MKPALLSLLVCPSCRGELEPLQGLRNKKELLEGELTCCGCSKIYPVRGGIPRFVANGSYAQSFGRQWNWFPTVQLDSQQRRSSSSHTLAQTTGWSDANYRGKLVLDAGVGAGRFAEVAAARGAEVVGVDLTNAVDAARSNLASFARVHLVQADIFALPFRNETFDLSYSIGVLHHTPDPREAFKRVAATVKPGGELAVYLYHRDGVRHRSADLIRQLTSRLPEPVMLALSAMAVPAYPFYKLPLIGSALQLVCPIALHPRWKERWLDTFDWYTPTHQFKYTYPEVLRWFREEGFSSVELFDEAIRACGRRDGLSRRDTFLPATAQPN